MDVKQFCQPTVRQAFRAIREDLGAEALVIASELVPVRGRRGWMGVREVQVTAEPPASEPVGRPAVIERRRTDPDGLRDGLVARLTASGPDRAMAEAVAAGVPADERRRVSLTTLRRVLAEQVTGLTARDERYAPVEVFIGPPGGGKTTTIAKIAAQKRARCGRVLRLVAADAFRAGAVKQLRAYAAIIGSPFKVAPSVEDSDKVLSSGSKIDEPETVSPRLSLWRPRHFRVLSHRRSAGAGRLGARHAGVAGGRAPARRATRLGERMTVRLSATVPELGRTACA